jgi:hypothetical protein
MAGNASDIPLTASVGSRVQVIAGFGQRDLSVPVAENASVLRLVCVDKNSTRQVRAVFETVAPGSTGVIARTKDCPGCAQMGFVARVTVRGSA